VPPTSLAVSRATSQLDGLTSMREPIGRRAKRCAVSEPAPPGDAEAGAARAAEGDGDDAEEDEDDGGAAPSVVSTLSVSGLLLTGAAAELRSGWRWPAWTTLGKAACASDEYKAEAGVAPGARTRRRGSCVLALALRGEGAGVRVGGAGKRKRRTGRT